jgi:transcription elongation factor Elf1
MAETKKVDLKDRFETCPDCGYENGFHMILIKDPHAFQLECPSCAQIYDLNLYCTLKQ